MTAKLRVHFRDSLFRRSTIFKRSRAVSIECMPARARARTQKDPSACLCLALHCSCSPMMKRTTHADEMNRCAPHMRMMSLLVLLFLLHPPLPVALAWRLTCRTKCFPPPSATCAVSLSLSLSGLISFDGKMNVIIARKKISFSLPISRREPQQSSVLESASASVRSPYAALPPPPPL